MRKIKDTGIFIIVFLFALLIIYKENDNLVKKDIIMKTIRKNSIKYKKEALNAKIIGNKIISGISGEDINYKKSYRNMKKYGNYNETLIEAIKIKPVISINDNYDKYIIRGNTSKRCVSLVFIVDDYFNEDYLELLELEKVDGTFFIDRSLINDNKDIIKKYNNHEYELLYGDNRESIFKSSISYLENTTKKKSKYCLNMSEDKDYLNICSKFRLHSIKPSIYIKNDLYHEIKSNLNNSIIIGISMNKVNLYELKTSIDYIKSKGYKIISLDNLVSED